MLKIALVGFGKMGKMIERLAGDRVVARIGASDPLTVAALNGADVAIEFTTPDAAPENLLRLAGVGCPTVCGSTGWHDRLGEVIQAFEAAETPFVYGSNFSVGVNIFNRLIGEATRLFEAFEEYAAAIHEVHHRHKEDHPSGTALLLANNFSKAPPITSERTGDVPGTHSVAFSSPADTITMTHEAHGREGFAKGALLAADMLICRPGIYSFEQLFAQRMEDLRCLSVE